MPTRQELIDWLYDLRPSALDDDMQAIRNAITYRLIPAIRNGEISLDEEIEADDAE